MVLRGAGKRPVYPYLLVGILFCILALPYGDSRNGG